MKKLFSFVTSCVIALGLSACGMSSSSTPTSTTSVSSESSLVTASSVTSSFSVASSDDTFSNFETALSVNGISYTEKVRMAAELIGGIDGFKYKTPNYNIEVYIFDSQSDAYKAAEKDGTVYMDGFGSFPVYVHNDMILVRTDNLPQEVIDLFSAL